MRLKIISQMNVKDITFFRYFNVYGKKYPIIYN